MERSCLHGIDLQTLFSQETCVNCDETSITQILPERHRFDHINQLDTPFLYESAPATGLNERMSFTIYDMPTQTCGSRNK